MFKFLALLLDIVHVFVDGFTRALECVEGVFQFGFAVLTHPGQWFRRASQTDEDDQNDNVQLERGADSFESMFAGFLDATIWLLFMPWRWFRRKDQTDERNTEQEEDNDVSSRSLESYADEFLAAAAGLLFTPLRWYRERRGADESGLASAKPKGFVSLALWHLAASGFLIIHVLVETFDFLGQWWYSRELRKLLWATPAMLLAIPLAVSLILTPLYSRNSRIKHYRVALASATDQSNSATERLCLQKLEQLGYQRLDRAEFQTAAALALDQKYEEAYSIMQKIAPRTQPGFLNAHLWIAEALLEGLIERDDPWEGIEVHVGHAFSLNEKNPFVKRLQGELHMHHGRIEQATEMFAQVVDIFPNYHATLMHTCRERGDLAAAHRHAKMAVEFLATDNNLGPDSPITAYGFLLWAESHNVLGDQASEFRVLLQGLTRYSDDAALRLAFDRVIDGQLSKIKLDNSDAAATIEELVRAHPNAQQVWQMLLRGVADENKQAQQIVDDLRSKNLLPAPFYKRLGDVHFVAGDYATAKEFYELACQLEPNSAFAWNNVGWILGNVEPVQIQSALDAVNKAIGCLPDPRFFETRGQILMKLERWPEAIADLQRAINGQIPNAEDVHRSLATAYDQLGNAEQAAAHRSMLRTSGT